MRARIINVCIRGVALLLRLSLVILLAKYLSNEVYGEWVLIGVSVVYGVMLLGWDFTRVVQFRIIKGDSENLTFALSNQIVAYGILYLGLLPVFLVLFLYEIIQWKYMFWFYMVLILEHLSQEISRILVVLELQIHASLCLFMRAGLWVVFLVPLLLSNPDYRELVNVLIAWVCGLVLSISYGLYRLYIYGVLINIKAVNIRWIIKGLKSSTLFLIGTLAIKGVFTLDKYVIADLYGKSDVAVYGLYLSMCLSVLPFLDSALHSFIYPRLMRAWDAGDAELYMNLKVKLYRYSLLLLLTYLLVITAISKLVIDWIENDLYITNFYMFPLFVLISALFSISMSVYYVLYSQKLFSQIVISYVIAFISFTFLVFSTAYLKVGLLQVVYSMIASLVVLLLFQLLFLRLNGNKLIER